MKLTADSQQSESSGKSAAPQNASTNGLATTARSSHRASCGCGGRCPRCRAESAAEQTTAGLATEGRPLDSQTLGVMESGLGHRLGDVRVHADASAASVARRRGAEAYASGRNVVFAAGRYQPRSPAGRELLAHELAHVVQQRRATQVSAGEDSSARTSEAQAQRAARQVAQGRRALLPSLGSVPGLQLQDAHRFGAGRQQVVVRGATVTVNGTRIPATAQPDGSILYRGREIVLDGNGIFRRRATGTIARPCNPEYYDSRGRRRPGVTLPSRQERSSQYYDPRTREHRPWNPPEVQRVRRGRGRPAEPAAPRVDEELATRMREVNRVRTDFETRVRALVDSGVDENLARRQVRLEIESGGRPLPRAGEFERGQTYSGSRGASGEVTITAARQNAAAQQFTRVAAGRLDAYLTRLNQRLGTRFVVNPQSLNHAEVRQLVLHPDRTSFYPDRAMCDSCQRIFTLEARARRAELVVVDPDGTARVFTPDGRIVEFRQGTVYERQTSVRTTGRGEQRRTRVEVRNDSRVIHRARPRGPGEAAGGRRPAAGGRGGNGGRAPSSPAAPPNGQRSPASTPRSPTGSSTPRRANPGAPAVANPQSGAPGATPRSPQPNRPSPTPRASGAATPGAGGRSTPPRQAPPRQAPPHQAPSPAAPPRPAPSPAATPRPATPRPATPRQAPPRPAPSPAATPRPATPRPAPPRAAAPAPGAVRPPTPAAPRGPGARVGGLRGGPRGGALRGVGGGIAIAGAMVVAEIVQLILDATVGAQLRAIMADLEAWQAERFRNQIEERLELHRYTFERQIERIQPEMEARWAAGQTVFLRVRYNVLYTDNRDALDRRTSILDGTSRPIESLFDVRFHGLENIRVELADSEPEAAMGEMRPARETTLGGALLGRQGDGDQRTSFLFNEPLLEQSVTLGQRLEPPAPAQPVGPNRVAQVTVSCNERWIAFHLADGTVTYELDRCDISLLGTYQAQITRGTETVRVHGRSVERPFVGFDLGQADIPEGQSFDFSYIVREGQENPATYFEGQDSVTLEVVQSVAPFRSPADMFLP